MFSERVHAESFFTTILDRGVKEEFLISNDIGKEKKKTPNNPPKNQRKLFRDLSLCSHSQFWE